MKSMKSFEGVFEVEKCGNSAHIRVPLKFKGKTALVKLLIHKKTNPKKAKT